MLETWVTTITVTSLAVFVLLAISQKQRSNNKRKKKPAENRILGILKTARAYNKFPTTFIHKHWKPGSKEKLTSF